MKTDQLLVYTKRKELSSKAKKEIIDLLIKERATNFEEIEQLIDILLKLHSDVIYGYIVECMPCINQELSLKFFDSLKKTNKSKYILASVTALSKAGNNDQAQILLAHFIQTYAIGNKINKQLFIDFEKTCDYDGSAIFFEKADWERKTINAYRRFLSEFLSYSNNTEYKLKIKEWFERNEIPMTQNESEIFKNINISADKVTSAETEKVNETTEIKPSIGNSDSFNSDIPSILTLLFNKYNELVKDASEKYLKIETLTEELKNTKLAYSELKSRTENQTIALVEKEKVIADKDNIIFSLNEKIQDLTNRLQELSFQNNILQSKLNNMESAYGQAGKNEIDELKNKIRGRLSSEYDKYLEIKTKDPDIDYYDILLAMLDEIYKVLKKNGINF